MIPFNLKECMDSGFTITGTTQTGKTLLAKEIAASLMWSGITVYIMDVSKAWLREDSPIKQSTTVTPNWDVQFSGSTVFDLSKLGLHDRVKFVNQFCRERLNEHVNGYSIPELVLFEEAQTYMPNGSFRLSIKKNPVFDGVVDFVTVGGNYSLRFGLITQIPSLVDKTPFKIAQQHYFGPCGEPNDFNYVKQFLKKEHRQMLTDLKKLEFIYKYSEVVHKFKVDLPAQPEPIAPQHSGQGYSFDFQPFTAQF